MKILNLFIFLICAPIFTGHVSAQTMPLGSEEAVKKIAAFEVLALHKSKIAREYETLQSKLTQTHPILIAKKYELEVTQREMVKILTLPESKRSLLNCEFGNLIVRKISAEATLLFLLSRYTLDAPQVRQASSRLDALENMVLEILLK